MSEKNKPNISIITVCRNPGRSLIRTMESILAQDYRDYEYIIKDGGSEDGTLDLISEYRDRFASAGVSFKLFSEDDNGIYDAMNKAVLKANGTWVNFMNAGDCSTAARS